MNHITAIIPYIPINDEHINITKKCIDTVRPMVDRIILIQNGLNEPEGIRSMVDVYIRNTFNILMAGAVNQGYDTAVSLPLTEYLLFTNNDVEFPQGDYLQSLCARGQMLSPRIGSQHMGYGAHASCFMIHKDDFKAIGYWNLVFGHAADENWFKRAKEKLGLGNIGQAIIHNHPALTNGALDNQDIMDLLCKIP